MCSFAKALTLKLLEGILIKNLPKLCQGKSEYIDKKLSNQQYSDCEIDGYLALTRYTYHTL